MLMELLPIADDGPSIAFRVLAVAGDPLARGGLAMGHHGRGDVGHRDRRRRRLGSDAIGAGSAGLARGQHAPPTGQLGWAHLDFAWEASRRRRS